MKYYSEVLKKLYDSKEECAKAEDDYIKKVSKEAEEKKKLAEERKRRAKEVEDAYRAVIEAEKNYSKLKNAFIKDYNSFHMTFSNISTSNLLEDFLKVF